MGGLYYIICYQLKIISVFSYIYLFILMGKSVIYFLVLFSSIIVIMLIINGIWATFGRWKRREFPFLWLQLREDVRLAGVPRQDLVNFWPRTVRRWKVWSQLATDSWALQRLPCKQLPIPWFCAMLQITPRVFPETLALSVFYGSLTPAASSMAFVALVLSQLCKLLMHCISIFNLE